MNELLAGRVGVVLGVSGENSVGFRCAAAMKAMGAEVVFTCRPNRLPACEDLAERAGFPPPLPVDLDAPWTLAAAFAELDARWGRLDFAVHAWMHVPPGVLELPLVEVSRPEFDAVMGAGVHSLIAACGHALPLLRRSAAPRVVALTSACGERMTPRYHVAGIAKAALHGAVLYLAHELGEAGVLCNAVSFSLLDTDGAVSVVGEVAAQATRAHLAKRAPTRQPVTFEDVAQAVAWLSSGYARNVTGEVLEVDGGFSKLYF